MSGKEICKPAWAPVMTPFNNDLSINSTAFIDHCKWLIDKNVGLAVFGTNSEANSLPVSEKSRLIELLISSGVTGKELLPGTGSCNLEDTVELTRKAVEVGCAGVLMLPPFYYKGVTDDGLFKFFSEVIERVGDSRTRIYLYHIPQVSQVPISFELISRLKSRYPHNFVGIKDSSGDWQHTQALISKFSSEGFEVYAGTERLLLDTLRAGGAGCISATANVNPAEISYLATHWQEAGAANRQDALNHVRSAFEAYPMIPAMKTVKSYFSSLETWAVVRPPLVPLTQAAGNELLSQLEQLGFLRSVASA